MEPSRRQPTVRVREIADRSEFDELAAEALARAVNRHGNLGLDPAGFQDKILAIARKNLHAGADWRAIRDFARRLNLEDLYLATACAAGSDSGWTRFAELHRKTLRDLYQYTSRGMEAPADLADQTLIDMFLPDRSGQSRIASYDGRSSLTTWLRVIVVNRTINEKQLACNRIRRVEADTEIPDPSSAEGIETALRSNRYGQAVAESIESACSELCDQDRLIILWRFEQGMQLGHIAKLLGVHQSTVTRQLERMLRRFRADVVELLASRYQLTEAAIEECLSSIAESSSAVSVLGLLRKETNSASEAKGM